MEDERAFAVHAVGTPVQASVPRVDGAKDMPMVILGSAADQQDEQQPAFSKVGAPQGVSTVDNCARTDGGGD